MLVAIAAYRLLFTETKKQSPNTGARANTALHSLHLWINS